jgi:hypothetical protein
MVHALRLLYVPWFSGLSLHWFTEYVMQRDADAGKAKVAAAAAAAAAALAAGRANGEEGSPVRPEAQLSRPKHRRKGNTPTSAPPSG